MVMIAAVAGFVSWWFTRFIIDDEELRIETGAMFKKSKKIPFERLQSVDIIQPLAARIFGLAELRLEAGAGDSTTKLRYLTRRPGLPAAGLSADPRPRRAGNHRRPATRPRRQPLTDLGRDRQAAGHRAAATAGARADPVLGVADLRGHVDHRARRHHHVRRGPVCAGRPDPAGDRRGDHDQSPGDLHVQLHPGRVAAGPADHPRTDQPDQPVRADQPDSGRTRRPSRCCGSPRAGTGWMSMSSATARATARTTRTRPPACCCRWLLPMRWT